MKFSMDISQELKHSVVKRARKNTATRSQSNERAKGRLLKIENFTAEFQELKVD